MKDNLTDSIFRKAGHSLAVCAFVVAVSTASGTIVIGDPADYESRRQQVEGGLPSVSAGAGDAGELRVFAEAHDGFLLDEGRPILQFDLSSLEVAPASATFSAELLSLGSNIPFAVELWGTGATGSASVSVDDAEAPGQFGAAGYEPAMDAGGILVDEAGEPGNVSADISEYLSARYEDYLAGGGSWIFLRLQPESAWSAGDDIDAAFAFASADHVTEALHPRIETVPIPEPARGAWILAVLAGVLACRRILNKGE